MLDMLPGLIAVSCISSGTVSVEKTLMTDLPLPEFLAQTGFELHRLPLLAFSKV